jgi:hypothetical protein
MIETLEIEAIAEDTPLKDTIFPPLFYRRTEPLTKEVHAGWRLLPGDFAFARDTNTVMLAASEFAAASRSYPILFAGNDGLPVALLGLERHNEFVTDGVWATDDYVPAYIRRYPFIFYATEEPDRFVLGLDVSSPRVARAGDQGVALFDGEAPSPATTEALQFCEAFRRDGETTRAFADALAAHDLLIDRRANVTLPGGAAFDIAGFKVVDRERFDALDDATLGEWHRKGWLAAVHFHLSSLSRFQNLLDRAAAAPSVEA